MNWALRKVSHILKVLTSKNSLNPKKTRGGKKKKRKGPKGPKSGWGVLI